MSEMNPTHTAAPRPTGEYLSFFLADDEYAVDILGVREIRGVGPITPLPKAPPHVRGVMNLRGAVVPVIDLRRALGLPAADLGRFTVIIVLAVRGRTMGFVVDSVRDVFALQASDVEAPPDLGASVDVSVIAGIARRQGQFITLLDAARVAGDLGGAQLGEAS